MDFKFRFVLIDENGVEDVSMLQFRKGKIRWEISQIKMLNPNFKKKSYYMNFQLII